MATLAAGNFKEIHFGQTDSITITPGAGGYVTFDCSSPLAETRPTGRRIYSATTISIPDESIVTLNAVGASATYTIPNLALVYDGNTAALTDGSLAVLAASGIYPGATIATDAPLILSPDGSTRSRASANAVGDATYQTIATKTIPAGLLGPNGLLRYRMTFQVNNSAATKQFIVKVNGVQIGHDASYTTVVAGVDWQVSFWNKNSQTVNQSIYAAAFPGTTGVSPTTLAIDTTAEMTLTVECKWNAATAAETISVLRDHVEIIYGA
jgi:hypothetical protein